MTTKISNKTIKQRKIVPLRYGVFLHRGQLITHAMEYTAIMCNEYIDRKM